jgi:hypothetical protein
LGFLVKSLPPPPPPPPMRCDLTQCSDTKLSTKKKFNKLCVEWNVIDVEIVVTKREAKCTRHWNFFLLNVSHSWVGMVLLFFTINFHH